MEDPERCELALSLDDVEYGVDPQAADEFVLQIGITDLEPKLGQRTRTNTRPFERAGDAKGFSCITQTKQPVVSAIGTIALQEVDDAGGASHGTDRHSLGCQVMAKAKGQRLDGHTVALALD